MRGSSSTSRFRPRWPDALESALVTETLDRSPDIGFASDDRLFPSQDTVPSGGFGNLIALPLQGLARQASNSVSWMMTSSPTTTNGLTWLMSAALNVKPWSTQRAPPAESLASGSPSMTRTKNLGWLLHRAAVVRR